MLCLICHFVIRDCDIVVVINVLVFYEKYVQQACFNTFSEMGIQTIYDDLASLATLST